MSIRRVEEIIYGVENVAECARYCEDFGLEPAAQQDGRTVFRTAENQQIILRPLDAPDLPATVAEGPGIREVIWGVSEQDDIERITQKLSRDRTVSVDSNGTAHSVDETGFGIGFRIWHPINAISSQRLSNIYGRAERHDQVLNSYGRAAPRRVIHVALDLPKEGHLVAQQFYVDVLGFKPVEQILPTGVFLQCKGEDDHHQLFLCHRTDRAGTNHVAFEARDFDEVIEGGNHMVEQGWKEVRRLGRHTVGSNLFRFFLCPLGGRFEYATDMDKVSKSQATRVWETSPQHHLWMIKTNGDS